MQPPRIPSTEQEKMIKHYVNKGGTWRAASEYNLGKTDPDTIGYMIEQVKNK